MYNQVTIIGKISELPKQLNSDLYECQVLVPDNFKSSQGRLKKHTYPIRLYKGCADSLLASASLGDVISLRGHLCKEKQKMMIMAECVSILN